MSDLKQSGTIGTSAAQSNTKDSAEKQVYGKDRKWCFTYNNYRDEDVAQLEQTFLEMGAQSFVFQEEIGKNKVRHLQGCVLWKNARYFNSMKRILPKAHWEQIKFWKAKTIYCSKEDTRNGVTIVHNVPENMLWRKIEKRRPLMSHQEMLDDMCEQMMETIPDIVNSIRKIEDANPRLYGCMNA